MENIWLMAQSLGISVQIISSFSVPPVESRDKEAAGNLLQPMKIAFHLPIRIPYGRQQILQGTPRHRRPQLTTTNTERKDSNPYNLFNSHSDLS